jgi:hypothetical protein
MWSFIFAYKPNHCAVSYRSYRHTFVNTRISSQGEIDFHLYKFHEDKRLFKTSGTLLNVHCCKNLERLPERFGNTTNSADEIGKIPVT